MRALVGGRLVNGYSCEDAMLAVVYRCVHSVGVVPATATVVVSMRITLLVLDCLGTSACAGASVAWSPWLLRAWRT